MNIIDKINTNITMILSLSAIFVGFTYFFINKSYNSFRNNFKIGYNEIWGKYEVSMALIMFCFGFTMGLYSCIQLKSIIGIGILRVIAEFNLFIILISDIILQYNCGHKDRIIKNLSGNKSKIMSYILSISTWLFPFIVIIYGFMSSIPVFIVIDDNMLSIALIALCAFIMWSFSFFGSFCNYISINRMNKKCVVLNDGKKYMCYIIGVESGFLIINRDKYIEYINLSLINRISEKVE